MKLKIIAMIIVLFSLSSKSFAIEDCFAMEIKGGYFYYLSNNYSNLGVRVGTIRSFGLEALLCMEIMFYKTDMVIAPGIAVGWYKDFNFNHNFQILCIALPINKLTIELETSYIYNLSDFGFKTSLNVGFSPYISEVIFGVTLGVAMRFF